MTTEERIASLEQQLADLKAEFYKNNFPQQQVFIKDALFKGTSSFTSLNPTSTFGLTVTPVARQSAISAPTGGATIDTEARTAINSIRTVLTLFGFTL